jgi:translation initiation factor IF-2
MGLAEVPSAGDLFEVVPSEREARIVLMERKQEKDTDAPTAKVGITLEQLFDRYQAGDLKELRIVLKADVQGSLEPIVNSLNDLSKGEINILHAETGNIGDNDVMLASASKAIIIGFNVQIDPGARRLAEAEAVSIRQYEIIYRMFEDVEKAMKGLLEPEFVEKVIGEAEVRAVFRISKFGNVAGCRVTSGEIRRNAKGRVLRKGEILHQGEIASLKHLQEDAREVRSGFECGISLKGFSDYQVGDIIESYLVEKKGELA